MRNIIITGANQGIGYYMAEKFLAMGDRIAILDIETDNLRILENQYGDRLCTYECDLTETEAVCDAVSDFVKRFGSVEIAIHNACICTFEPMQSTAIDTYKRVYDVNFLGAVRLTKAVIPYMEAQGKGKVIFTSSGVGVTGFIHISPYAASKGALESFAKCMNCEYAGKEITFHLFHPPLTNTKSASPLPIPAQMKADPKTVGYGLAKNASRNSFVICHSFSQKMQMRLCYLLPNPIGKLMSKMTSSQKTEEEAS